MTKRRTSYLLLAPETAVELKFSKYASSARFSLDSNRNSFVAHPITYAEPTRGAVPNNGVEAKMNGMDG